MIKRPKMMMPLLSAAMAFPAAAADKWEHHLFNPTPPELMRPMSADRPDVTESAYTVDAGHLQVEMSFAEYVVDKDRSDDADVESFSAAPLNVKVGLLNHVDFQLVIDPYVWQEVDDDGESDRASGLGFTQTRLKINLWGNDGGPTALAIMPFIQFPTSDDDFGDTNHLEGGVILPLAVELPRDWGLGLMAEVDFVRDAEDSDYEIDFVHTATVGHDIVGNLAGYAEYVGIVPGDDETDYIALINFGLTYGISENVQLDGGVNVGLTEDADDLTVFSGVTFRL